jgi:hypothetical protein
VFLPQSIYPADSSARRQLAVLLQMSVPIFDSGQRASFAVQRQAALESPALIWRAP